MDSEQTDLKPKRIALFFNAADGGDLDEVVASLADDGESRGLFFEWAAVGDMELGDVVNGSPLHQALSGSFPDR